MEKQGRGGDTKKQSTRKGESEGDNNASALAEKNSQAPICTSAITVTISITVTTEAPTQT